MGVISLPGGVFNPYSGVKTSILWIDKALAKRSDKVIFLKVNNDGFDLGAQRRPIDANDLPDCFVNALAFKNSILSGGEYLGADKDVIIVEKARLAKGGDYSLNGERYVNSGTRNISANMVELRDIVDIISGGTPESSQAHYWDGDMKWATLVDLPKDDFVSVITDTVRKITDEGLKNSSARLLPANSILVSSRATIGRVAINKVPLATNQGFKNLVIRDPQIVNYKYLAYIMRSLRDELELLGTGGTYKEVSKSSIERVKIPLPSLSVQEELVAEMDSYQKIIDGAKQVVDNWKPRIDLDQAWARVRFGEICRVSGNVTYDIDPEGIYIGADSIEPNTGNLMQRKSIKEQGITGPVYHFSGKKLLYSKLRPYLNKLCIVDFEGFCSSDMYPLTFIDSVKLEYARYYLLSDEFLKSIENFQNRARIPKINREQLFSLLFPLPDLDAQEEIIRSLEVEEKLVESSRRLIQIYEKKIKERIDKQWKS